MYCKWCHDSIEPTFENTRITYKDMIRIVNGKDSIERFCSEDCREIYEIEQNSKQIESGVNNEKT